jgi:hypothetical protein
VLQAGLFRPKPTMGNLKPYITSFIQRGIAEISTPEMNIKIQEAFANDGCFTEIRSPEMALIVQLEAIEIMIANQEILIEDEGNKEENEIFRVAEAPFFLHCFFYAFFHFFQAAFTLCFTLFFIF